MVFEKGGVCGALAKTFANLNGMVGVPSFVVGQPGHAATLTYELRANSSGKMVPTYRIQNDVSGWGRSKAPSAAHWQCGWGASSTSFDSGNYILYSQDALSDWDGYVRSLETRLLASTFENAEDRSVIAQASRGAQEINFDAIRMQIDVMAKKRYQRYRLGGVCPGGRRRPGVLPACHARLDKGDGEAGGRGIEGSP